MAKSQICRRSGNTYRKHSKTIHHFSTKRAVNFRIQKGSNEGLLTLTSAQQVQHGNSNLEALVPYSLKKKARWRIYDSLIDRTGDSDTAEIDFSNARVVTVEDVTEIPRLVWTDKHLFSFKVKEIQKFFAYHSLEDDASSRTYTRRLKSLNISSLRAEIGETKDEDEICFRFSRKIDQGIAERLNCKLINVVRFNSSHKSLNHRRMIDFELTEGIEEIVPEREESHYETNEDEVKTREVPQLCLGDFLSSRSFRRRKIKGKRRSPVVYKTQKRQIFFEFGEDRYENKDPVTKEEDIIPINLNDGVVMEAVDVILHPDEVSKENLVSYFAHNYWEGASTPRHFAINISDFLSDLVSNLGPPCKRSLLAVLLFEASSDIRCWSLRLNAFVTRPTVIRLSEMALPSDGLSIFDVVAHCVRFTAERFGESLRQSDPDHVVAKAPDRALEPLTGGQAQPSWSLSSIGLPSTHHLQIPTNEMDSSDNLCAICMDDVDQDATGLVGCSHRCCEDCWRTHLVSEVRQGRVKLRCPAYNCTQVVDHVTVLRFLSLTLFEQHRRCKISLEVEQNPNVVRCPNPPCQRLIQGPSKWRPNQPMTVRCICSQVFCFACRGEGHWPASCDQWSKYRQMAIKLGDWRVEPSLQDEIMTAETMKKVKIFGQTCPDCRRFMEKSYGCNSMVCICGTNFCYQCGLKRIHHPGLAFPCSSEPWVLMKQRLKSRFVKDVDTTMARIQAGESNRCILYRKAQLLRFQRFDLGNCFRFRQRYKSKLDRLYCHHVCEDSPSKRLHHPENTVYSQLIDMLRLSEYCFVFIKFQPIGTRTFGKRLVNAADRIQDMVHQILSDLSWLQSDFPTASRVVTRSSLETIFDDAKVASRQIHGLVNGQRGELLAKLR